MIIVRLFYPAPFSFKDLLLAYIYICTYIRLGPGRHNHLTLGPELESPRTYFKEPRVD